MGIEKIMFTSGNPLCGDILNSSFISDKTIIRYELKVKGQRGFFRAKPP
jgi:hypothetical protein